MLLLRHVERGPYQNNANTIIDVYFGCLAKSPILQVMSPTFTLRDVLKERNLSTDVEQYCD